ncbi:helix-turn-helix transcriptional regulator [Sunxiuqinia sp. sy24]|uniref:helix-turn-helix transcriptional regulator n=1 Tax=Sunxiuqinia sp. sy24 TaxID=3461495 RepID=UPI004045A9D6
MSDQHKLQRMLEMMIFLSSGIRRRLSEISDRFTISERTAFRYIQSFREAGFIIPKPIDGYYYIDKDSPYFCEISELLHFSKEEAYILQKAIHSISDENLLKQNLIRKLYALYDFDRVADTIVKKENSENIHHLMQAIKTRKKVILHDYYSANSSDKKDRLVEPFEFTTSYVATWAYDLEDNTCKTFKNTRITSVQVLNEPWENESNHRKLPMDVFRISSNQQVEVKLMLSIRACELLKEEYPLAEEYIQALNEHQFLFEAPVCSFEGVGRFVLGLGNEVEVLEPQEFRLFLKKRVEKIANDMS